MKLALAWLCLGSLATGQTRCALEGRVVDQKTGQPVARAHLFVIREAALTAIRTSTNEQGRFCFAQLDAGSYHAVAQRTGYLEALYQGVPHPGIDPTIEIKLESRVAPVTIKMVPRPILVGTVVDADGVAPVTMPPIDERLAELMRAQIEIQDLVVEAALKGDPAPAFEALRRDPLSPSDEDSCRKIFDELVSLQGEALPF